MAEHITSKRTYLIITIILLLLTFTTVEVSFIDLGPWNFVVALGIAIIKASLIVLYFMHMRQAIGTTKLVLLAGLLWLGILLVGIADDFVTRGWLGVPGGK